ncbi:MAG: hypothetical protein PHR06_13180 [Candidatus Cloacimonetes bacterium]|nr:hypothetical protein [Candidatus Cloacimonadota bacterium]
MTNNTEMNQPKKKPVLKGCLTVIIVFFVLCAGIGIIMSLTMDKVINQKSKVTKYIDVTDEQATAIEKILNDCGIEQISSIEHDELLDNAHIDGETGYRVTTGSIENIILYLSPDKSVNQVRYVDHDLYADGSCVATIQDYTVSKDELDKYQSLCKEKVKEVLKSPSTAKFPNYTEWGFGQDKNTFTVQGYVDAQNGLGAETRSNFQFIINIDSDTIQSFIFDGEELIK